MYGHSLRRWVPFLVSEFITVQAAQVWGANNRRYEARGQVLELSKSRYLPGQARTASQSWPALQEPTSGPISKSGFHQKVAYREGGSDWAW